MPPGNLTNLTDAERAELLAWIDVRIRNDSHDGR